MDEPMEIACVLRMPADDGDGWSPSAALSRSYLAHGSSSPPARMTDEATFTEWYAAHYPALVRYARSFVGDTERAQDVVQEAFFRLWRRRGQVDTSRPVRPLLYRAVRNLALNERRNGLLRRTLLHRFTGRPDSAPPDEATDALLLGAERSAEFGFFGVVV
jgi:DNA-directed RNA polymerase specialized sigma24 family protein